MLRNFIRNKGVDYMTIKELDDAVKKVKARSIGIRCIGIDQDAEIRLLGE